MADLSQAMSAGTRQAKTKIENFPLAWTQVIHQIVEGFLAFVVIAKDVCIVVRHRFGELEVAVIIEHSIQADWGASSCLQVGQVFQATAGSLGEFLGAG